MEHLVYLGLGANVGDRQANLRAGLQQLAPEVEVVRVSGLYETDPVGVLDQPKFLNAACEARTELGPEALLKHVKGVERLIGRVPGERWGPRVLDIDLLLYDQATVNHPDLQIPHERLTERAFVLRPLADLDPSLRIPGLNVTVSQILERVDSGGVRPLPDLGWERSAVGRL